MLEAAQSIRNYTKGGKRAFLESALVQDAVIRRFMVLGEAAGRLSLDFREASPQVPWKTITRFRNVLVHGYDAIDPERVWDAVRITLNDVLPALQELTNQ